MLTRVRFPGLAMVAAVLGAAACGDRGDRVGGAPVSAEEEVEALDPALADSLPEGATFEMAQEGRGLFVVCATCHGLDAAGTQLAPSLRDTAWIHPPGGVEGIAELIRAGVAEPRSHPVPMPPMGGGDFSDEQLRALATYVYVLGRPRE